MTAPRSVTELVELHEKRMPKGYLDSLGKLTIGVGRCLDTKPLRDFEIDFLRDNDIRDADKGCVAIFGAAEFAAFAPARQAALVDMVFQLGHDGLLKSPHAIAAIKAGDWAAAADHFLGGPWEAQTPARAHMNTAILRTGEWPA